MAKPGWAPLLPLQGDAPKFCLLGDMAKPGWAPLLPLREGGDGWLVAMGGLAERGGLKPKSRNP